MQRPSQDAIDTFMRITGVSQSVAVRKLEEYGGNIHDAVNAHFSGGNIYNPYHSSAPSPQQNVMDTSTQTQPRQGGLQGFLNAARSFKPSLLLDPSYRRNLYNQISSSTLTSSPPPISHPENVNQGHSEFNNWSEQLPHGALRPTPENANGSSSSSHQMHGDDIEEEMIKAAIEASKQDSSGTGLPQRQLHQEDDDLAHAISLSLKTAEQEEAIREQQAESQVDKVGIIHSNVGSRATSNEKSKWGDMTSKEIDEAIMLETALFGGVPTRVSEDFLRGSRLQNDRNGYAGHSLQPSPSSLLTSLTKEQSQRRLEDDECPASSVTNIDKGASREAETQALKQEESSGKISEEKEVERRPATKEASLPQEPSLDDKEAVSILVRMPDGSRLGRRLLKSNKLQLLFDFIDVSREMKPGTYSVVRPYPRQTFSIGESSLTLSELGLTSKQEALFLELI